MTFASQTAPRRRGELEAQRRRSQHRREVNRALGRCINHPLSADAKPHGPPVPGKGDRCEACSVQHARTR